MAVHPYAMCERTLLRGSFPSQAKLGLHQTLTGVLEWVLPSHSGQRQ
jgi:hypothetical protein